MSSEDKVGCSIIICCHNSATRLYDTLSHLGSQVVPCDLQWEVLLVDNASTDNTSSTALSIWNHLNTGVSLRIVHEPKPGLVNARRTGVLNTKFNTLIFCDDDNWLSPSYVAYAFSLMQANPAIGVAGGRHKPALDGLSQPPDWFYTYADGYAVGVQAMRSGDISARGYVWGAGMVLRATLLRYLYSNNIKPLLSGRSESSMQSGDDSEICMWYRINGYKLWYDEKLSLSHYIPHNRQSLEYVERLYSGFSEAGPFLNAYSLWIDRRDARSLRKHRPLKWLRTEFNTWKTSRHLFPLLSRIDRDIIPSFPSEMLID